MSTGVFIPEWTYTLAALTIFLLTLYDLEPFRSLPCTTVRLVNASLEFNRINNVKFCTTVRLLETAASFNDNSAMKTPLNVHRDGDLHPFTHAQVLLKT